MDDKLEKKINTINNIKNPNNFKIKSESSLESIPEDKLLICDQNVKNEKKKERKSAFIDIYDD